MSTLAWILVLGVAMAAIAMAGSITLALPEQRLEQLLLPLVALAAGSLLGGAFLHMLPEAIDELGNTQAAAGNFTYIAATDLLPELTTSPALSSKAASAAAFATGLATLWAAATYL